MNAIRDALKKRLHAEAPENIEHSTRKAAAVLVPFFEVEGEPHLLFTKRSASVQQHRSEISFPGGARDDGDRDLLHTALRELREEVAVPPEHVEILGSLDPIYTYSSLYIVVPFVGLLTPGVRFAADPREVEELLQVPLRHLADPSTCREEKFVLEGRTVPVYYYRWRAHTIWGLTGRILKTLLDLMQEGAPT